MRRGIYFIGLLLLLLSCTDERQAKDVRMQELLKLVEEENRLEKRLPSDTVFQEVVNYYDDYGNANQRMKAHYLMGCIYRDMHETPMALQYLLNAAELADTLAPDCDYVTLMKIYGQMARIYHQQLMPEEQLKAYQQYSRYALKTDSVNHAIQGVKSQISAYQLWGDTAMILALTDSVHKLYLYENMPQEAAGVYAAAIRIYLARRDYTKAKQLMDIYEHESGFFDAEGNTTRRRGAYYGAKGNYYFCTDKLDSAEYFYRKLEQYGYYQYAYDGLMAVFNRQHKVDSVMKYNNLYKAAINQYMNEQQSAAIRQVGAMYDYSRNQRIAEQREREVARKNNIITSVIVGAIVLLLLAIWFVWKQRRSKQRSIAQMRSEVIKVHQLLTEKQCEIDQYHQDKEQYEVQMQAKYDMLKSQFQQLNGRLHEQQMSENFHALQESDIAHWLHTKGSGALGFDKVSEKELGKLHNAFQQYMPYLLHHFHSSKLTHLETTIAMLVRLSFTYAEIMIIMDTQKQNIRNIKSRINKKMFDDPSAESLFDNREQFDAT